MGWGTTFTTDIFINRKKYDDIKQVDVDIEETKKSIQYWRERILMQCAVGVGTSEIKDCEGNPVNTIESIHIDVDAWLEEYDKLQIQLYDLLLLHEDWDEREQKFLTAEAG